MFGNLSCKVRLGDDRTDSQICGQKFTTPVNSTGGSRKLTDIQTFLLLLMCTASEFCAASSSGVRLMSSWVDACEEASARAPPKKAKVVKPRSPSPRPAALEDHDEDEDDVDEDNLEAALNKRKAPRAAYDDDDEDNHRSKAARRAYDSEDDD